MRVVISYTKMTTASKTQICFVENFRSTLQELMRSRNAR